jgi:UDP-glucose:(heptosyl)LPS alpha-1,3-glucosyltransferase
VNIALVKKDFSPTRTGGLEKVFSRLLDTFQEQGHTVTVIHSPGIKTLFKFRELQQFDRYCTQTLKKSSFDIILSLDRTSFQTHHRAGNGVHAAYLDLRRRYESRLWSWSFPLNPLHRTTLLLEKKTFEDPNLRGLIVNSHLVRSQVLQFYSTPSEKIHVIHNGVEWSERENDFQLSFSSRPDRYTFLFVGHNFRRKGLAPLVQALRRLPHDSFHLLVVGHDKNSAAFHHMAQGLNVTFLGPQPTLTPFYQLADALVLPSLYDPFANVTVEALAMGLFVITSTTNGGHEVLTPTSGIALNQPIDIDELTASLHEAMKHPKTFDSATAIRSSVQHLDFPLQLERVKQVVMR